MTWITSVLPICPTRSTATRAPHCAFSVRAGYPEELIHAVEAHATFLGVPRVTLLDKALLACDELTGLIQAAAYVRPDRDLRNVELKSIKKKWKDKAFTAAIDRHENMIFIEELGVPFDEHIGIVLAAMQSIAPALGVAGEGG
jgi:predicted hydrolase (HD superfamily)